MKNIMSPHPSQAVEDLRLRVLALEAAMKVEDDPSLTDQDALGARGRAQGSGRNPARLCRRRRPPRTASPVRPQAFRRGADDVQRGRRQVDCPDRGQLRRWQAAHLGRRCAEVSERRADRRSGAGDLMARATPPRARSRPPSTRCSAVTPRVTATCRCPTATASSASIISSATTACSWRSRPRRPARSRRAASNK